MIPVNRPLITSEDLEAVSSALASTYLSGETPPVSELEKNLANYVGTADAVAVSTGTSALDLVIESLDIKQGDHCVVPNFTIISTVSNLMRKTQNIDFIDADPITWSINSDEAASKITEKTKLVLPVHIYGLPVDLDPILQRADEFGTFVLEDAAEALGVGYKGRLCGSIGNAGVFSFFANKIVTGGEGGAITTNDKVLAKRLRSLRNLSHSSERFVHHETSWNLRMAGLPAALINSQLLRINKLIEVKKNIAEIYRAGLQGHPWFQIMPDKVSYGENLFWVVPLLLNENSPVNASRFQVLLKGRGVDSRRFFCPMNLQPAFRESFAKIDQHFPISEALWERGLYLPSGLGNTRDELESVISVLWELVDDNI